MASSNSAAVTTLGNFTGYLPDTDFSILLDWIDSVPVSRRKKNIARDFSDVLAAEIIGYYTPKIIQVHNYSSANAVDKKKDNWDTMNRKVFPKLKLKLTDSCIKQITEAKTGVVEMVLWHVRRKIIKLFPSTVQKIHLSSTNTNTSTSTSSSRARSRSPAILPTKSGKSILVPKINLPSILEADDQTEDSSTKNLTFSTIDSVSEGESASVFDGYQSSIDGEYVTIIELAEEDQTETPGAKGMKMVPISLYENLQKENQHLKKIGKEFETKWKTSSSLADAKEKRVLELTNLYQKVKLELTRLQEILFGTPIIPRQFHTSVPSNADLTDVSQATTSTSAGRGLY